MHVYGNLDNICITVHMLFCILCMYCLACCTHNFGHMCLFILLHAYIVYITPTYTHAFLSLCVLMLPNKIVNGFKMNIKMFPMIMSTKSFYQSMLPKV